MTAHEALTCLGLGLALIVGALLWREHDLVRQKLHDVAARFRVQEKDMLDLKLRCPDKDFLRNMDARLIGLEAKLDHMTRLLSTLVEIRNGKT